MDYVKLIPSGNKYFRTFFILPFFILSFSLLQGEFRNLLCGKNMQSTDVVSYSLSMMTKYILISFSQVCISIVVRFYNYVLCQDTFCNVADHITPVSIKTYLEHSFL